MFQRFCCCQVALANASRLFLCKNSGIFSQFFRIVRSLAIFQPYWLIVSLCFVWKHTQKFSLAESNAQQTFPAVPLKSQIQSVLQWEIWRRHLATCCNTWHWSGSHTFPPELVCYSLPLGMPANSTYVHAKISQVYGPTYHYYVHLLFHITDFFNATDIRCTTNSVPQTALEK